MKKVKRRTYKVCNKCGTNNPLNARECKECESDKFAPSWVLEKRCINRQVSVEVTKSNPKYGESTERITLSKWWPGDSTTFHIPSMAQWEKIESIINNELAPLVGWKKKKEIIKDIKDAKTGEKELNRLIKSHPDILQKIVSAIDPKKVGKDDINNIIEIFGEISDALTNANAGFREAFLNVIKKLPKQKQRALEDLELLLKGWSLQIVTNVAQQVRARIETIELFEKQILDEKTFEIKGKNSIHRILERAMWLIDERYWLMHSNKALRTFIGDEMSKRDKKKYGSKRPDFVCGTVGNKLIILELKRPSHTLNVDDLNQIETYTVIAEDYKNFSSYEAYLIGTKEDEELRRRLKRRSSAFRVLHYADIIDKTKQRYHDFMKTIENES